MEDALRKIFKLKELQPTSIVLTDSDYARVDAALGKSASRSGGPEIFYRAPKGHVVSVLHAQPLSWEGAPFHVAVLVSPDGYLEKTMALAAPPGLDTKALDVLRRASMDEAEKRAAAATSPPAKRLLEAAREGHLKVLAGYFRTADLASISMAQAEKKMPSPAADSYELLKTLMETMMANYQSAWFHLKRGNTGFVEAAVVSMSELGAQIPSHDPKINLKRRAEFVEKAEQLRRAVLLMADNLRRGDRAKTAKDLLDVYHVCQGCHETFSPEESAEKRKYAPEF